MKSAARRLVFLAVSLLSNDVAADRDSGSCSAEQMGLTVYGTTSESVARYCITTNVQLQNVTWCKNWDYFCLVCSDCTQETLDQMNVTEIRGKDPVWGISLILSSATAAYSLLPFSNLVSVLPGSIILKRMNGLTTLDGLHGIRRAAYLAVTENSKLESVLALTRLAMTATTLFDVSKQGEFSANPLLACVPSTWPAEDSKGNTIRTSGGTCECTAAFIGLTARTPKFVISTDVQLQNVLSCRSIDSFCLDCGGCTQATLNRLQLATIRSKDSTGESLGLYGSGKITSLMPFSKLKVLPGRLRVDNMNGLTNLDGLHAFEEVGRDVYATLQVARNDNLESVLSLYGKTRYRTAVPSYAIKISENPKLACVPAGWPERDSNNNTILGSERSEGGCECTAQYVGLTNVSGRYCVTNELQLQNILSCKSIDYFCLEECGDCQQTTLDRLQLVSIMGRDPMHGHSLVLQGASNITSIDPLEAITGIIVGGILIARMSKLATLDGLGGLTQIGADASDIMITIDANPVLRSTLALANPSLTHSISISNNAALECAPDHWPLTDRNFRRIRAPDTMCYERYV